MFEWLLGASAAVTAVTCPVTIDHPTQQRLSGVVSVDGIAEPMSARVRRAVATHPETGEAIWIADWLVFEVTDSAGTGTLTVDGFEPVTLTWSERGHERDPKMRGGRCGASPVVLTDSAAVSDAEVP